MRRHRQLLNRIDDQIAPIWFVFGFHTIIHILGIFVMMQFPHMWKFETSSHNISVPIFHIVALISCLSFIWASLRLDSCRPIRLPVLILMCIPVLMSAGTATYAYSVSKGMAAGRAMLESELVRLNEKIDRFEDRPHSVWWEIEERDRLQEILK